MQRLGMEAWLLAREVQRENVGVMPVESASRTFLDRESVPDGEARLSFSVGVTRRFLATESTY